MTHGVYRVIGRRAYRGHAPGSTFEAALETNAERRAITRGDIQLIRRVRAGLRPGSFSLPLSWSSDVEVDTNGASPHEQEESR